MLQRMLCLEVSRNLIKIIAIVSNLWSHAMRRGIVVFVVAVGIVVFSVVVVIIVGVILVLVLVVVIIVVVAVFPLSNLTESVRARRLSFALAKGSRERIGFPWRRTDIW